MDSYHQIAHLCNDHKKRVVKISHLAEVQGHPNILFQCTAYLEEIENFESRWRQWGKNSEGESERYAFEVSKLIAGQLKQIQQMEEQLEGDEKSAVSLSERVYEEIESLKHGVEELEDLQQRCPSMDLEQVIGLNSRKLHFAKVQGIALLIQNEFVADYRAFSLQAERTIEKLLDQGHFADALTVIEKDFEAGLENLIRQWEMGFHEEVGRTIPLDRKIDFPRFEDYRDFRAASLLHLTRLEKEFNFLGGGMTSTFEEFAKTLSRMEKGYQRLKNCTSPSLPKNQKQLDHHLQQALKSWKEYYFSDPFTEHHLFNALEIFCRDTSKESMQFKESIKTLLVETWLLYEGEKIFFDQMGKCYKKLIKDVKELNETLKIKASNKKLPSEGGLLSLTKFQEKLNKLHSDLYGKVEYIEDMDTLSLDFLNFSSLKSRLSAYRSQIDQFRQLNEAVIDSLLIGNQLLASSPKTVDEKIQEVIKRSKNTLEQAERRINHRLSHPIPPLLHLNSKASWKKHLDKLAQFRQKIPTTLFQASKQMHEIDTAYLQFDRELLKENARIEREMDMRSQQLRKKESLERQSQEAIDGVILALAQYPHHTHEVLYPFQIHEKLTTHPLSLQLTSTEFRKNTRLFEEEIKKAKALISHLKPKTFADS